MILLAKSALVMLEGLLLAIANSIQISNKESSKQEEMSVVFVVISLLVAALVLSTEGTVGSVLFSLFIFFRYVNWPLTIRVVDETQSEKIQFINALSFLFIVWSVRSLVLTEFETNSWSILMISSLASAVVSSSRFSIAILFLGLSYLLPSFLYFAIGCSFLAVIPGLARMISKIGLMFLCSQLTSSLQVEMMMAGAGAYALVIGIFESRHRLVLPVNTKSRIIILTTASIVAIVGIVLSWNSLQNSVIPEAWTFAAGGAFILGEIIARLVFRKSKPPEIKIFKTNLVELFRKTVILRSEPQEIKARVPTDEQKMIFFTNHIDRPWLLRCLFVLIMGAFAWGVYLWK